MKKFIFGFFFMTICMISYGNQVDFLNQLNEKETATFSDCVICFNYLAGFEPGDDFDANVQALIPLIPIMPKRVDADTPLTIGDFSLLAIQYLKIESGLFYLATKTGRYASRELTQVEILPMNISEWEKISGIELIRLFHRMVEYVEEKNSK